MTSAPSHASICVHDVPASNWVRSRTRMPFSALLMVALPRRDHTAGGKRAVRAKRERRRPLRPEAHLEAHVRESGRALERFDRNDPAQIVVQVERRVVTYAALEPASRAQLERHAERAREVQDNGL